ncbi:hypothetical protein [Streptomyces sulphureus]|nr:hypothetical protein [Streptomyces sulphureus]
MSGTPRRRRPSPAAGHPAFRFERRRGDVAVLTSGGAAHCA